MATLASSCSSVERRGVSHVQLFGKERSRAAAHRAGEKGGGGGLKSNEVERAPAAGHSTTDVVEGEEGGTLVWLIFGVEKGERRRELGAAVLWLR
jgi:hypothetical protein